MSNYGLVLAFDTDDFQFCRGVEFGSLYIEVKQAAEMGGSGVGRVWKARIHRENELMACRLADAMGLHVRVAPLDDSPGWLEVSFERLTLTRMGSIS